MKILARITYTLVELLRKNEKFQREFDEREWQAAIAEARAEARSRKNPRP